MDTQNHIVTDAAKRRTHATNVLVDVSRVDAVTRFATTV